MIKVELPAELPQEIVEWQQEAEQITQRLLDAETLEEKHQIIDRHQRHWRAPALVNWLSDKGFEKCWFTETKFGGDYQEVEHFRPKKGTKEADGSRCNNHDGYYWLAFNLSNYRLCKRRTNLRKSTFFPIYDDRLRATEPQHAWCDETPMFLDPLKQTDVLLLSFNDNGVPVAQESIGPIDAERVKFTIDKYYLDERILNTRRAETWATTRALYNEYLNAIAEANRNGSVAKRAEAEQKLIQIQQLCSKKAEFSSVAREALMKLPDRMAWNIASKVA
ncbi:hypothetical protein F0248_12290 [Vibrio crassostreae]|uniref:hypothetical protein n=1 Tax=Vibrio crassostreae TaxID=246167 RepID=UPI00148D7F19|nr:hypothetical protein [Vibrio crassostreae]NOI53862.1 hypothetical protein [Vibrio crassostreae]